MLYLSHCQFYFKWVVHFVKRKSKLRKEEKREKKRYRKCHFHLFDSNARYNPYSNIIFWDTRLENLIAIKIRYDWCSGELKGAQPCLYSINMKPLYSNRAKFNDSKLRNIFLFLDSRIESLTILMCPVLSWTLTRTRNTEYSVSSVRFCTRTYPGFLFYNLNFSNFRFIYMLV